MPTSFNKSGSAGSISFFFFFVNKLLNNSLLMGQDSGVFNICVQLAVSCASKPQLICVEIWQALNFSKQLILSRKRNIDTKLLESDVF